MLFKILACLCLLAITVAVHSIGLVVMMRSLRHSPASTQPRAVSPHPSPIWLLTRVVWGLMALHVLEIGLWAAFYWWRGAMPDLESALYFSGVTYATIGYGDLVLPAEWRFLAPIEGVTGILMAGLSTAYFLSILGRIHGSGRAGLGPH